MECSKSSPRVKYIDIQAFLKKHPTQKKHTKKQSYKLSKFTPKGTRKREHTKQLNQKQIEGRQ